MLDWCVKTFRLLVPNTEEGSAHVGTYLVPTERGPPFCKNIPADRYPTCVPKARWVCVSVEHNRIGLLAPEEFLAGQQLSLADYMPLDERYWDLVCKEFSYNAIIKIGGNAFHSTSAGAFSVSCLLLPRFRTLLPRHCGSCQ